MKVLVRLVILVASLLLVSNSLFAGPPCDQELYFSVYMAQQHLFNPNVVGTPVDNGYDACWDFCIKNSGGAVGTMSDGDQSCDLYEFAMRPFMGTVEHNDGLLLLSPNNHGYNWKAFMVVCNNPAEVFYIQIDEGQRHISGVGVDDDGKAVINGYAGCY
jgi:hypothetical protein